MDFLKKTIKLNDSNTKPGVFNRADYPEEYQGKNFYFHEYCRPSGEVIKKDEAICKIRVGEKSGYFFNSLTVLAQEDGVLEWTLNKDNSINSGYVIYKLHPIGTFEGENSTDNSEYKHYFKREEKKCSLDKWLVEDGIKVLKGARIYEYDISGQGVGYHYAEKEGFIDIVGETSIYDIKENELLYYIRETDEKRIETKYENKAHVIEDVFEGKKTITWEKVSSIWKTEYRKEINLTYGIVSKSDDNQIDFTFTFNYLSGCDFIIFHFSPKQVRPKLSDKILFLFNNGKKIEFEIKNNPIIIKNLKGEKVLEFKSELTQSELELFQNKNFKKWKIDLRNEEREILGGNIGGIENYKAKENLITVIRKFANDYVDTIKKEIVDYTPKEIRSVDNIDKSTSQEICYVYLMHDTSNGFYKIGISNKPKYREKTLQSEKPTIELITAKKFPVRKIAESIEKSLHQVYSAKRLRGEWFKLNKDDIENITESLK
jgi:hypothetical protein